MKNLATLLAFIVSWQLQFAAGGNIETTIRTKTFTTKAAAQDFMAHRPFDYQGFECVESVYGRSGMCAIHDMHLTTDGN